MTAANDLELGELVAEAAATMIVPKLKDLRVQSGEVLEFYHQKLELAA